MKIIGVYRKCDIVTMAGTCFALSGILCAVNGKTLISILCLIFAAICDAFDGVVARRHQSKKEQEIYGTELDSLSDVISFGVLPMLIVQNLTVHNIYTYIISVIFVLCGVIRLAYFNMLSITKQSNGKEFIGLPITASAMILPMVYFICMILKFENPFIFPAVLLVTGILYVLPFKLRKLTDREKLILSVIGIIAVVVCILKFVIKI